MLSRAFSAARLLWALRVGPHNSHVTIACTATLVRPVHGAVDEMGILGLLFFRLCTVGKYESKEWTSCLGTSPAVGAAGTAGGTATVVAQAGEGFPPRPIVIDSFLAASQGHSVWQSTRFAGPSNAQSYSGHTPDCPSPLYLQTRFLLKPKRFSTKQRRTQQDRLAPEWHIVRHRDIFIGLYTYHRLYTHFRF